MVGIDAEGGRSDADADAKICASAHLCSVNNVKSVGIVSLLFFCNM